MPNKDHEQEHRKKAQKKDLKKDEKNLISDTLFGHVNEDDNIVKNTQGDISMHEEKQKLASSLTKLNHQLQNNEITKRGDDLKKNRIEESLKDPDIFSSIYEMKRNKLSTIKIAKHIQNDLPKIHTRDKENNIIEKTATVEYIVNIINKLYNDRSFLESLGLIKKKSMGSQLLTSEKNLDALAFYIKELNNDENFNELQHDTKKEQILYNSAKYIIQKMSL
ncbi:MAG: hypothetical protein LBF22_04150 [Deltaproteobacteria bacterium]|jgi:hypothetical protein|nr:hypothetical protein [Deltaproteobacteria bacterium]